MHKLLLALRPRRAKQGPLRARPAVRRRSYEPLALAFIALIALPAPSALAEEDEGPGDVYLEQPDGGAINARTGEYYAPAGPSGVIDTETGEFYPKAGPDGYINPGTGQYHPAH